MAQTNRPAEIEPERRLARGLVDRHGLRVPVDIHALLEKYASVEEVDFPANIASDAAVDLMRARANVFINTRRSEIRQRFTEAHELAHIYIPWHTGGAVCNPLQTPGVLGPEGEANTFASEVLIPRYQLDLCADVPGRIALAQKGEISDPAMAWAVADSLGPGHVLVLCRENVVEGAFLSPGTDAPAPYRGTRFTNLMHEAICRHATNGGSVDLAGKRRIRWWAITPPPTHARRADRSRDLIDEILHAVVGSALGPEATHLRQSISGVVGAANSKSNAAEADELVAIFHQRFVGKEDLSDVMDHDLFTAFLWAQADEMARRKRLGITRKKKRH